MSEDIFDQDRVEERQYEYATSDEEILLPLTRHGFEALLSVVTRKHNLPLDDASRLVIAGYIHHVPNEVNTTTIATLGKVLHKAVSNSTTWRIDQEIKEKRRKALAEEKAKEDTAKKSLELVEN